MRVSLIHASLPAHSAVGQALIHKAHFFLERGDEVRIFLQATTGAVPGELKGVTSFCDLGDLLTPSRQRDSWQQFSRSDLIVYEYGLWYPLAESIKAVTDAVVLFDYHGVTPPELWANAPDRDLLIRSVHGAGLVHHADLAIAHSEFMKDELVTRYTYEPARIRVLPLPGPLEDLGPGPKDSHLVRRYGLEGKRVLLYVGRMAPHKRVDLLVQALARIHRQQQEVTLLLVGDDASMPAYVSVVEEARQLARALGVAQAVIFTGPVPDLTAYYRLADIFLTASLHEGFGVPIIEAQASGVPVVASDTAALPETVGDAGLTFAPGDVDDLAEKVLTILEDDGLRDGLVQRGLTHVRAYSIERFEKNLARIIDEAEERRHQPQAATRIPEFHIEHLSPEADVALRDYVVRSRVPLVGRLVEWVRRNLTSHVKEAYLDRIVERQVLFNQSVEQRLNRLERDLEAIKSTLARLEQAVVAQGEATPPTTRTPGTEETREQEINNEDEAP